MKMGPSSVGGTYKRLIAVFGLSAVMALPAAMLGNTPAMAYQGCQSESTISASSPVVNGGVSITVTVDVRDCNGNGVEGVQVVFGTQSGPCQVGFSPAQATTDANGVATTQATLPTGCPCQYVLSAKVASGNLTLTTTVRENGCLPFTSAAAAHNVTPSGLAPWAPYSVLLGLAALLILAATGVAIQRRI